MLGESIYSLAKELQPIYRSITGDGVRETLKVIQNHIPSLQIHEVPSGTKVFDWIVPLEWKIVDAYIITPTGEKICHFSENHLHVVGYSIPINQKMSLSNLKLHLHSLPEMPDAIPYVTSYYKTYWGFCLSENQKKSLVEGEYEVFINSELFEGHLTYGEIIIKGLSEKEVFLSTYICHPYMANNELSGPAVATFLAKWILQLPFPPRYTYRLIFIPETIGSITYLSKNLEHLKNNTYAGFNISCVGDNRTYSYLPSRKGNTISDIVAKHVLKNIDRQYKKYTWSDRGSDERQYCAPHIDLPIASIMRSKYGEYPEYHTSLDNFVNVVTPEGLEGGYHAIMSAIKIIEENVRPWVTVNGEPQLGRRGLYPTISDNTTNNTVKKMMDIITWSDGSLSLLEICDLCEMRFEEVLPIVRDLQKHGILELLEVKA